MENAYIASLPPALIAASAWTAILAALATPLRETKSAYLNGVLAAALAYLVAVGLTAVGATAMPTGPGWPYVIILAPLVEETVRLAAAQEVARKTGSRFGIAFGLGYGLLESGLKLGDQLVLVLRSGSSEITDWLTITVFIVPLLLHVFLSMLVFMLLRRRVPITAVFAAAVAFHASWNWSVIAMLPQDVSGVLLSIAIRTPVLLALIALMVLISRRPSDPHSVSAEVTSVPLRANTRSHE
jgi:hypothetical protein